MLARCSIRLSTPPSEVARFHSATRAAVAIGAGLAAARRGSTACRRTRRASAAPRPRGRGGTADPGRAPRRPADGRRSRSAMRLRRSAALRARAGTACACRAAAATPRTAQDAALLRPHRPDPPPELVVGRASQRAGDHVGVTVQVLGRRVHDEVGAQCQRPRQHRRRHGRVDGEPGAGAVRDLGRGGDVGDLPQRVGRRLQPDQPRPARPHARRQRRPGRSVSTSSTSSPQRAAKVEQPGCAAPST